jgi:hypothetical protein
MIAARAARVDRCGEQIRDHADRRRRRIGPREEARIPVAHRVRHDSLADEREDALASHALRRKLRVHKCAALGLAHWHEHWALAHAVDVLGRQLNREVAEPLELVFRQLRHLHASLKGQPCSPLCAASSRTVEGSTAAAGRGVTSAFRTDRLICACPTRQLSVSSNDRIAGPTLRTIRRPTSATKTARFDPSLPQSAQRIAETTSGGLSGTAHLPSWPASRILP